MRSRRPTNDFRAFRDKRLCICELRFMVQSLTVMVTSVKIPVKNLLHLYTQTSLTLATILRNTIVLPHRDTPIDTLTVFL